MSSGAPVGGLARPPETQAAARAGASVRPTVRTRPVVPVVLEPGEGRFEASDPYVRRFWVAAIGPGAVAELLRLIRAAAKGEDVRLPRSLPLLIRAGLVRAEAGRLVVVDRIPVVPRELRWRFPPSLAADHGRWISSRP